MNEVDAAWVAGLLEGEACFDTNAGGKRNRVGAAYPRIRIEMKDRDVLVKLKDILGGVGGEVREVIRQNPNHSNTYCYQVGAKGDVKVILEATLSHYGERRREAVLGLMEIC